MRTPGGTASTPMPGAVSSKKKKMKNVEKKKGNVEKKKREVTNVFTEAKYAEALDGNLLQNFELFYTNSHPYYRDKTIECMAVCNDRLVLYDDTDKIEGEEAAWASPNHQLIRLGGL